MSVSYPLLPDDFELEFSPGISSSCKERIRVQLHFFTLIVCGVCINKYCDAIRDEKPSSFRKHSKDI